MDDPFDPLQKIELAMLRVEHQKKFQVMIDYLKSKVGEGTEYSNSVVRVVIAEQGAYYELHDLPEEFSGVAEGEYQTHFIAREKAIKLLKRAVEATKRANARNTRYFSIIALYTRRGIVDRKNCFVYDFRADEDHPKREALTVGKFQPETLPLFFKIKVDADFAKDILEFERGLVFCMANAGDRHLLVCIPYTGDQIINLTDLPMSNTIQ